ncbi:unnamed protein product [Calypogeia fissa]
MPPSLKSRNDNSMCDRLPVMWTKEEDDILREQVELHGIDKWAKIATHLCGKTSRQCRRRWHMFLNVVNKRGGWSADEDELLLEAHRKFGNRWTEIAKKLPGRTDNAVKNRFCVLCKRQTKEVEGSPLQRPLDSGSDTAKQQLLEGPKVTLGSGANKKMRTEANHKRKPGVAVQQKHLEETLQQWKGLQSSEELTSSPHPVSTEECLPPWDSVESNVLHRNTQADKFQGWTGLAMKGKGHATHPQMQPRESFPQWDKSQSGAGTNEHICSTSSRLGEARAFNVQSQGPSIGSSCNSRLMQENLQQWKRANLGDGTGDRPHHHKMLKTSHSTWCSTNSTDDAKSLLPQQKSDNELLRWWKGLDKNTMSSVALQHTEVPEALPDWEKSPQVCVTTSLNQQKSMDENLPPLSQNSLPAAYMSNSKECTLLSGMQRWSMLQTGKPGEHVQQSNAGGTQTWDNSLAKEANTANTTSKENVHEWQHWNSSEVGDYSLGHGRSLAHSMEIDNPKPDDSAESIPLEASVKTLSLWTGPNCQQANEKTVLQLGPEGHETQEWKKSQTPTKSPRQLLEDRLQQLDNSQAAVHPSPLLSMLSRFAGSESKSLAHMLSAHAERQGRYKAQFIEESWKTAVEKLKCKAAVFSSETKTQSPRGVLGFEEYMSGGSKDSDLETAAEFSTAITNPSRTSKADDSKWASRINVTDGEDGEMTRQGLLAENSTTCESSTGIRGVPNDEVKMMTTEGEASRVTEPPTPDIQTDGAHSPTEIAPRSHPTMECTLSPQFSDSEKEFLLSTLALDQTTTNCSSSSPLRPQSSRFSKVRNPLIDIRYDTPARSPLSSCLLRQFQVSDTPNPA